MPLSRDCRFSLRELALFKSIGLAGSLKSLAVRFEPFESVLNEVDVWRMTADICFSQALLGPDIDAIHRGWNAIKIHSPHRLTEEFEALITVTNF